MTIKSKLFRLQDDDGFEREFDEHNFDNAKEQKILIEHEDDTDSEDDRMQLESQVRLQIRRLYNDPEGGERSKQQMEAVILSQQAKHWWSSPFGHCLNNTWNSPAVRISKPSTSRCQMLQTATTQPSWSRFCSVYLSR